MTSSASHGKPEPGLELRRTIVRGHLKGPLAMFLRTVENRFLDYGAIRPLGSTASGRRPPETESFRGRDQSFLTNRPRQAPFQVGAGDRLISRRLFPLMLLLLKVEIDLLLMGEIERNRAVNAFK